MKDYLELTPDIVRRNELRVRINKEGLTPGEYDEYFKLQDKLKEYDAARLRDLSKDTFDMHSKI